MSSELTIGELSKVTGLSVKAIRFYHERGLIVPARVETGSGYRYFDHNNVETARVIVALRDMEFSIDEIKSILADCDSDDVLDFLAKRKHEVESAIQSQKSILRKLDQMIQHEQENKKMWNESSFEIERRTIEPMLVAGIRMKGRYSEMGTAFGKLGRSLGAKIGGKAMCLYYDQEYREDDADFEPCFPIKKSVSIDGIDVREISGGEAICLKHLGPYEQIGRSYEKLLSYAKQNCLQPQVPTREVYLKGPGMIFKGNPKKYITEIQFLIEPCVNDSR